MYFVLCLLIPLGFSISLIMTGAMFLIGKVRNLILFIIGLTASFFVEIALFRYISLTYDKIELLYSFIIGITLWFVFFFRGQYQIRGYNKNP